MYSKPKTTISKSTHPHPHRPRVGLRDPGPNKPPPNIINEKKHKKKPFEQLPPASPASVASISPAPVKFPDHTCTVLLDTPDIWEAMSTVAHSADMHNEPDHLQLAERDAGLVAWERMDTLMNTFEYGRRTA